MRKLPFSFIAILLCLGFLPAPAQAAASSPQSLSSTDKTWAWDVAPADRSLGWAKWTPTAINQAGPVCTSAAATNALRVLLVARAHWAKDLSWRLDIRPVWEAAGFWPEDVAHRLETAGTRTDKTLAHPNMTIKAKRVAGIATRDGLTGMLRGGPTTVVVPTSLGPHSVLAVYADQRGVMIYNSWGSGWGANGLAWVSWDAVVGYSGISGYTAEEYTGFIATRR